MTEPVRFDLELSPGEPLHGRVRRADAEWEPFTGWAALAIVLGRGVDAYDAPGDGGDADPPGAG